MPETRLIAIDPLNPDIKLLQEAADALKRGEVIAFPTDTVYGIGADALNVESCNQIFKLKGRPANKPLIIFVAEPEDVEEYALEINPTAQILIKKFWPGPLTLIFRRRSNVPDCVTAAGDSIGIRCPDNEITRELIRRAGLALATTSANLADMKSTIDAEEVNEQLNGRVAYIIDTGKTKLGIESTVVDASTSKPRLVREGYISWSAIIKAIEGSL